MLKNLMRGGILKSGVQGGMAGLSLLLLVVHAADSGSGPHAESGPVSSAPSRMAQASQRAEFGHEPASAQARDVAHWVMASGDHQGRPFVVEDVCAAAPEPTTSAAAQRALDAMLAEGFL